MQLKTVATAALFVASAAAQSPMAKIYNRCSFDVYLWSVSADGSSPMITLDKETGSYNETYQSPTVGGVSLKLSATDNCDTPTPITQFEYTLAGGSIWYDISNVNCVNNKCPFAADGMYMDSGDGCPTRSCEAGLSSCAGAYNQADDNQNSLSCTDTANIELYLCTSSPRSSRRAVEVEIEAPVDVHRHRHRHPHWRSS